MIHHDVMNHGDTETRRGQDTFERASRPADSDWSALQALHRNHSSPSFSSSSPCLRVSVVKSHSGFTLVELLVVITVIGVLVALLLPAVQMARESGRRTTCLNNQRNIALAMVQFEQSKKYFPGYVNSLNGKTVGWVLPVLPYLGRGDLLDNFKLGKTYAGQLDILLCPSAQPPPERQAPLSFVVNCGRATGPEKPANGVFLDASKSEARGNSTQYIDGHDGTTYTLLTTENLQALEWTAADLKGAKEGTGFLWHDAETPERKLNSWLDAALPSGGKRADHARPSSNHSGGVQITMCDSSARWLREDIDYAVYVQLMTPFGKASDDTENRTVFDRDY